MHSTSVLTALVLTLSALIVPRGVDAVEVYRANLRPNPGVESSATGTAVFELNDFETEITFTVSHEGLSSPEIAAHVHRADGSILFDLPAGEFKNGVWQNPGPVAITLLRQNSLYVLVHSEAYPQGELRGDLSDEAVATSSESWGAVKALYDD